MNARRNDLDWPVIGWFEKANHDLRAAHILIADPEPLTDVICFHCQQAAEKVLKGFLAFHGVEFARVHDMRYLANLCLAIEPAFHDVEQAIVTLNDYAVEPRYPADLPIYYPVAETRQAMDLAEQVVAFVMGQMPPDRWE
ncbi:MAG: HEPN domain-containing protein [Anaerolineae bacterium]|nr:HEPN domain-containing protein [Anaerolineae bacterium]